MKALLTEKRGGNRDRMLRRTLKIISHPSGEPRAPELGRPSTLQDGDSGSGLGCFSLPDPLLRASSSCLLHTQATASCTPLPHPTCHLTCLSRTCLRPQTRP